MCFLDHAGSALMVTGGIAVEVRNVARDRERMFVCGIIVWLHSWRMPCMEGDAVGKFCKLFVRVS